MAGKHLEILKQGVDVWNQWREDHPEIVRPDLGGADLNRANLTGAILTRASLYKTNLTGAILTRASLYETNLNKTNLYEANLSGAHLERARLIETRLEQTTLTGASIYGISAWNIQGTPKEQTNLIITSKREPTVTVDDLKIAQFIYLLLNNAEIRDVIDTVSKKVVLILGRFSEERKAILEALRAELRNHGYLPILFDFEKPMSRDLTETISTLAHLSRFIVADITDARSIPQELMAIVPNLPSVVIRPIIVRTQREYAMFEHFGRYPWVLPLYEYDDIAHLLSTLTEQIIAPAEQKVKDIAPPFRT